MKLREARALGLKKYSTGKPCIYFHLSERSAQSGHCCECTALRNKYQVDRGPRGRFAYNDKKFRERHREEIRRKSREYYANNLEKMREKNRLAMRASRARRRARGGK